MIFVFTDAPTKDLENLEDILLKTQREKELTVMTIHAPKYGGQCEDASWKFYHKLGQVGHQEKQAKLPPPGV